MKVFWIALVLAAAASAFLFGYRMQQAQRAAFLAGAQQQAQADKKAVDAVLADVKAAIDEDDDEAAYRDAMAKKTLTDNCLICHDERMIASQRLTPPQWKSEVDKMLSWGAMLPDADRAPLEEYLGRHYGEKAPVPAPALAALADLPRREIPGDPRDGIDGADVEQGGKLYTIVCASCHGPAALGTELGPALVDRAALNHAETFHEIVEKGLRKMPAMNAMLNAEQRRDLLAWLRGRDAADLSPPPKP